MEVGFLFDMDGVIVDNHQFHVAAWTTFSKQHGINLTEEDYKQHINGRTITGVIAYLFNNEEVSTDLLKQYGQEKEQLYRDLYGPHLKAISGLEDFLKKSKSLGIKIAVGTSAPPENVTFTLGGLGLMDYFESIIDERGVTKGKPDPQVYLKSAENIGLAPNRCIVFEDALSGIQSGKNAGMKVVGLATTHSREEIAHTDLVIDNFENLDPQTIVDLLK
jgi:beta-phosphoglucomutase